MRKILLDKINLVIYNNIRNMALTQDSNNLDFIRPSDLSSHGQNLKIIKVEKKVQHDKFKDEEIERYFLTFSNGKMFPIQNETNLVRLLWNFGTVEESLNKEIWLYSTQIEVSGKQITTIRIRYNILDKIKK